MRVSRVETFLVPPRWLFVRIETDAGAVGWGEASLEGHSDAVRAVVNQFEEYLVGSDLPHDEARLQAAFGRAEAGQPCGLQVHAGHVVRELTLKELHGIGAAGSDHTEMSQRCDAAAGQRHVHRPLSSPPMSHVSAGFRHFE